MRIAVIPARGGSKRIPGKNIKPFCGKPMIAWSIEAALKSKCFEQVIVSTDDEEIASISRNYGADIPFVRPISIADNHTGIHQVIAHTVDWFQNQGITPDYFCCIYATAPFIQTTDIQSGLKLISEKHCDYVISVTSFAFPIQRASKIEADGKVGMFYSKNYNNRSQDLEEAYHDAGQFIWASPKVWKQCRPVFTSNSYPVILPRFRVQDIDTQEDWERAELMFKALKLSDQNQ